MPPQGALQTSTRPPCSGVVRTSTLVHLREGLEVADRRCLCQRSHHHGRRRRRAPCVQGEHEGVIPAEQPERTLVLPRHRCVRGAIGDHHLLGTLRAQAARKGR